MIDQNKEKKQHTIDLEKMKYFLDSLKKYFGWIYNFFKDNKNNSKVMLIIAIITFGIAMYFGIQLYNDIRYLNNKTSELINLKSYDTRTLEKDTLTQPIVKISETIDDLIKEDITTQGDIYKYTDYLHSLQIPYTYFLQYIYLPSLNIRKEKYTEKIDINLIGIKFLEKNPFNDITLLQKRGDFFKNLGDNNESNDVLDMKIGDIIEDGSGYFSMPITVSFQANSKRAFLLISDKLSMTSNKENISLINEFFYYLRNEIKKNKDKEVKALEGEYSHVFGTGKKIDEDKMIGYHLYNRIFNGGKNTLIDNAVIDKTIKSIISCNNESDEVCYYKFRERYRNIPTFGYLLGTDFGTNGAENLRRFILQLPPLFSIKTFEFNKIPSPTLTDATNISYQGKVTIVVYGRSASSQEVEQIAKTLGQKCLWEEKSLTTKDGLNLIQSAIVKLSEISTMDKSYGDNLRELKGIIEQLEKDFPDLSNYKKTIKLFELYRMLSDSWLCK
jgi:hypothetical protein